MLDVALIPIKPLAPYWYLYSLFFLYLIFSGGFISRKGNRLGIGCMAVIAAVCGSMVNVPWFSLSNTLYYSLFFYVGIVRRRYGDSIIKNKMASVFLFLVSVAVITVLWDGKRVASSYRIVNIIVALGIILVIWQLFENVRYFGNSRFLRKCGEYCLEIYVLHHTLAAGFRAVFPRIGIGNAYISMGLNMLFSTSIPVIFAVFCKKIGIHGLLFHPVTWLSGHFRRTVGRNAGT